MSVKIKFQKVTINAMTIENAKEKVPMTVERVEEYKDKKVHRITFKRLDVPGFVIQEEGNKVKFVHSCEKNSKGQSCSHMALAMAIAKDLDVDINLVGFPTEPIEYPEYANEDFQDVSEQFGVIPPVVSTAATATTSEPEEDPTPLPKKPSTPSTIKTKRDWTKEWNSIQDYLYEQGLTSRQVLEVRDKRKIIFEEVELTPYAIEPKKPDTPYMGATFGRVIRHLLMGERNLILQGDKGSGKDTLISTIAWVFGYPSYLQAGNGGETKESVVGENTLKNGNVEFEKSPFATSVAKGGLCHYAELNMLQGDVTSIFHSVLDDNNQLATPVGSVERHPHHIFVGSINAGDQYVGTKKVNGAFKDRCSIIKLPYVADFREMIIRKTDFTDSMGLEFLENTKKAIDKLIAAEGQGEESKTIRGYIQAAKYLKANGITFESKVEALEDFVINKTEDFEEQMAVRQVIREEVWNDFPMSEEEENYINGGM